MNVVRSLGRVQPSGSLLRGRPFVSRDHVAHLHAASGARGSGSACRAASDVAQQPAEGQAAAAPTPKVRLGTGFCFWPISQRQAGQRCYRYSGRSRGVADDRKLQSQGQRRKQQQVSSKRRKIWFKPVQLEVADADGLCWRGRTSG